MMLTVHRETELAATKARANFFMLSAELRNSIYGMAVVSSYSLSTKARKKRGDGNVTMWTTRFQSPALLSTSRQIRQEALPVFWGLNTFKIRVIVSSPEALLNDMELHDLRIWKKVVGDVHFNMIKKLEIKMLLLLTDRDIKACGEDICERAGATAKQLKTDLEMQHWDKSVILQAFALKDLGLSPSKVKLTMKGPEEWNDYDLTSP